MIFFKIEDLAKRSTILSPWNLRINDIIVTIVQCNGIIGRYVKTNAIYRVEWINDTQHHGNVVISRVRMRLIFLSRGEATNEHRLCEILLKIPRTLEEAVTAAFVMISPFSHGDPPLCPFQDAMQVLQSTREPADRCY